MRCFYILFIYLFIYLFIRILFLYVFEKYEVFWYLFIRILFLFVFEKYEVFWYFIQILLLGLCVCLCVSWIEEVLMFCSLSHSWLNPGRSLISLLKRLEVAVIRLQFVFWDRFPKKRRYLWAVRTLMTSVIVMSLGKNKR